MGTAMLTDSILVSTFLLSRYYTFTRRMTWDWIVLHDAEAARSSRTAENIAAWLHGPAANHVSAHYCVDQDSIVQTIPESCIAWAAGHTANQRGIHIEIEGFAHDDLAMWLADPATGRAALLVRDIATRRGIPIEFLDSPGLVAGHRGITTHREISIAFHESDHTDPGAAFPIDTFVGLARG